MLYSREKAQPHTLLTEDTGSIGRFVNFSCLLCRIGKGFFTKHVFARLNRGHQIPVMVPGLGSDINYIDIRILTQRFIVIVGFIDAMSFSVGFCPIEITRGNRNGRGAWHILQRFNPV